MIPWPPSVASRWPVSAMNAGGPDILLVEDSATTAELFAMALRMNKSSATVQIVRDGVAALDLLLGSVASAGSTGGLLPRLLILEETFFTFSFSPIRDEKGDIVGLFHPVTETTGKMLGQRRTRALRDLAAAAGKAQNMEEAMRLLVSGGVIAPTEGKAIVRVELPAAAGEEAATYDAAGAKDFQ